MLQAADTAETVHAQEAVEEHQQLRKQQEHEELQHDATLGSYGKDSGASTPISGAPAATAAAPHLKLLHAAHKAYEYVCPKFRVLRPTTNGGGGGARAKVYQRVLFTAIILALVVLTAALAPDSVSAVWQVAGSSVGKLNIYARWRYRRPE